MLTKNIKPVVWREFRYLDDTRNRYRVSIEINGISLDVSQKFIKREQAEEVKDHLMKLLTG